MNPINTITTMRLPDGSEVAFVDWQDKPLFSTVDLLAGFTDTEIDAFTYVAGDDVPATVNATVNRLASENDTNVSTPGSMASTEEMLVYAIKPEILESRTANATPTDLTSISFQQANQPAPLAARLAVLGYYLNLRLVVSQKVQQEASLAYFNTGFGVMDLGNFGLQSQEAVRSFVIPIHIGGQEKYRVSLVNRRGTAVPSGNSSATPPVADNQIVHSVRIYLDGLYKRPVS